MFIIKNIIRGGGMKYLKNLLFIPALLLILIGCSKNKPPNTPASPAGASSGIVSEQLSFSAHTTDPDDDDIAYQFEWGDGNLSSWSIYVASGDTVSQNHSYNSMGTYEVRVKAKDTKDKESEWSSGHVIEVDTATVPYAPSEPSGPDSGYVDSTYSFFTSTTDVDGDSVAYQFDWGDGNLSPWSEYISSGDTISMNHSYSSIGIYEIKTKAKDESGDESDWSSEHSMVVYNPPPEVPSVPSGPDSGYVDSTYTFTASTIDPEGDNIAYQFDWGDGSYSSWSDYVSSGTSVSMDHSYSSVGIYEIKTKAKDESGDESDWSSEHSMVVYNPPPEVPSVPSGPDSGCVYIKYTFTTSTIDPEGDNIAYQFDWGDGNYSTWSSYVSSGTPVSMEYTYYSTGIFGVKARAKDEDGAESNWSSGNSISISRLKWKFVTGYYVESSPAIGSDSTIYVGSYDAHLYAINPDGSEKWSFYTVYDVHCAPAIGSDGIIYVATLGGGGGELYAINPDGTEKWSFPIGSHMYSSPAIASDGTVYACNIFGYLRAINTDGTLKWGHSLGSYSSSSPAIASDGTIYVGADNNLCAVNPNGTGKWSFPTEGIIESSPAIGSDSTIYVGSSDFDNHLYAINPDGTEKWSFPTEGKVCSPSIGSDGTIYVGSFDGNLYAINPDGTEKWSFSVADIAFSAPAIGLDGTIYVGSSSNGFYAINPDGTEKWSFSIAGGICSSPAIDADGVIYMGSYDNNLYAIYGSSGGLANTPWPMFLHDLKHTGRVKE